MIARVTLDLTWRKEFDYPVPPELALLTHPFSGRACCPQRAEQIVIPAGLG
jgi:hypothetical protein